MKINKAGIDIIKKWESFRSKPYLCPRGIPTIGYGTTVYPNGRKVTLKDKPITIDVAHQYLLHHIESQIYAVLNEVLQVSLSDNRYSALVSLVYNIGMGAFKRSTLLKVVNAAPGAPGIRSEFGKWIKGSVDGKKVVLPGLVSRRKDEADLYFA